MSDTRTPPRAGDARLTQLVEKWRAKAATLDPEWAWITYAEATAALEVAVAAVPLTPEPQPEIEEIRTALNEIERAPDAVMAMCRKHQYVFRRFPRDMEKEPPLGDGERWEAMAFSIYNEVCACHSRAIRALNALDELVAPVAAPPSASAPAWQSIESAPKDGTNVLLWWPFWCPNRPTIGYFGYKGIQQWFAPEVLEGDGDPPTHWMPLPAPPPPAQEPR